MAEETKAEERVDAAAVMDALKGIKDRLDSAHSRLDAFEASRKDADEEKREKEEREKAEREAENSRADRKARHDAARKDRFGARKDGESDEDLKARHDADEKAMCDELVKGGDKEEEAKDAARHARKDADEEDRRARDDKARKDAEEQARKDSAAVANENADLKARLAALEGRFKEVDPKERDALAAAQARFDSVAGLFGERVPAPIGGESSLSYRRRMLQRFLKHSSHFKDSRLDSLDSAQLALVENQVLSDAEGAARHDAETKPGILVPHVSYDEAGRRITKFHGDPLACWAPFMTGGQCGSIVRKPGM